MKNMWRMEWRNVEGNKLRDIKDNIETWQSSNLKNRKESIIMTRLRIGHTRLTHQYLMEGGHQPYCDDCIVPLTVKHVLAECPSFGDTRQRIFPETQIADSNEAMKLMIAETPGTPYNIDKIMSYLRDTGLYNEII